MPKKFPSTYVTADIVVFRTTSAQSKIEILLIQRRSAPFKDHWALPGGFFDPSDQDIYHCATRELFEETNLHLTWQELHLLDVYSKRGRDPRENNSQDPSRILSVAFWSETSKTTAELIAKDDAASLKFFDGERLPPLAFDHGSIISAAMLAFQKALSC